MPIYLLIFILFYRSIAVPPRLNYDKSGDTSINNNSTDNNNKNTSTANKPKTPKNLYDSTGADIKTDPTPPPTVAGHAGGGIPLPFEYRLPGRCDSIGSDSSASGATKSTRLRPVSTREDSWGNW